MKLSRLTPVVFIVWLVFYMFGNNMLPVTDPVESNYALTAKEMVLSGDWLSPQIYGTYWYDKPIMIYWLIALGFKIFGIADWVVRLPSAIFGALSVATMYQSTRTMSGKWALGLIGASVLGTSHVLDRSSWRYYGYGAPLYDIDGHDLLLQGTGGTETVCHDCGLCIRCVRRTH